MPVNGNVDRVTTEKIVFFTYQESQLMNEAALVRLQDGLNGAFFWSFKKGDNTVHNFEILHALYEARRLLSGDVSRVLIKPILLILISIIEVILDDFFTRIIQHRGDKIPNLTKETIDRVRTTKKGLALGVEELTFEITLQRSQECNIFQARERFYSALSELRDVRNRIHIQDKKRKLKPDEKDVFTPERLSQAEEVLEHIVKIMIEQYPRSKQPFDFENFPFPWKGGSAQI